MRDSSIFRIEHIIEGHFLLHLAEWFHKHLAVLGEVFCAAERTASIFSCAIRSDCKVSLLILIIETLIAIIIAHARLLSYAQFASSILVGTVHIADIAAAEHVAIAVEDTLLGAYLAAVDVHLRLSEDIAVGVELALLAQVVVASAAGKHIAVDMAVVHLNAGLAALEDGFQLALGVLLATQLDLATADGRNLATAEDAVADIAAIHKHIGEVDVAVVDIAAAEDAAAVAQTVEAYAIGPRLVVKLLLVVLIEILGLGVVST